MHADSKHSLLDPLKVGRSISRSARQHDTTKGVDMGASEQLDRASEQLKGLAARASAAEAQVEAAKTQGQQGLQEKVAAAKESAKNSADNLKSAAADAQGEASNWWGEVQNNWKSHIDTVRANADEAKANLDAKVVLRRADRAEDDAAAAVEFAYAAYEEAEYQVLNAALARMDADAVSAE